jgi:hypothetical protein
MSVRCGAVLLAVGMLTLACSLVRSLDDLSADYGKDQEGGAASDGASESATYNDVASPSFWSTFDVTSLFAVAHDFAGGTFDGRYVYYTPSSGNIVVRYDTRAPDLRAASAWSVFDASLDPNTHGFAGAVFDGRYVTFVPAGGASFAHGIVTRYDTQAEFGATSSWRAFDTRTVDERAAGFFGAAFDGRYLYFAPNTNNFGLSNGVVARFDTQGDLAARGSWSTFDIRPFSSGAGAGGYHGAVFDGQYVYFIQNQDSGTPSGMLARYDTHAEFGSQASWSFVDLRNQNAAAKGFFGGAFDGRYVYAIPGEPGSPSLLARYDTRGSFSASWTMLDTLTLGQGLSGFGGAAFDGQHVYLVPRASGTGELRIARVDTRVDDFRSAAAWSRFDVRSVDPRAAPFTGAIFDGRFLYLAPSVGGIVARFDAKAPAALPVLPAFHGSFL